MVRQYGSALCAMNASLCPAVIYTVSDSYTALYLLSVAVHASDPGPYSVTARGAPCGAASAGRQETEPCCINTIIINTSRSRWSCEEG